MPQKEDEQILTKTDLKILKYLKEQNKPTKIGDINHHLDKWQNRSKDRLDRLEKKFINKIKDKDKRVKNYSLISDNKTRNLVELLLEKFKDRLD
jgi:DNA-binding MarR family transcriptional regulator